MIKVQILFLKKAISFYFVLWKSVLGSRVRSQSVLIDVAGVGWSIMRAYIHVSEGGHSKSFFYPHSKFYLSLS